MRPEEASLQGTRPFRCGMHAVVAVEIAVAVVAPELRGRLVTPSARHVVCSICARCDRRQSDSDCDDRARASP